MIIVLKPRTSDENVKRVENMVRAKGLEVHTVKGEDLTIIGCIGDTVRVDPKLFEVDSSVEKVMHVQEPYKLSLIHISQPVEEIARQSVGILFDMIEIKKSQEGKYLPATLKEREATTGGRRTWKQD